MDNLIYIPFRKGSIDYIIDMARKGNSFETIAEVTKLRISVIKCIVRKYEGRIGIR